MLFTSRPIDGPTDLATFWLWGSFVLALMMLWTRMVPGILGFARRVRYGERIPTLEVLRAKVNLDVQQFETRWALADYTARSTYSDDRFKIHEASRNLMKQILHEEQRLYSFSPRKPLEFMTAVDDFESQARELSRFIQRTSFGMLPSDMVGYGLDGAQPLNHDSGLFLTSDAFESPKLSGIVTVLPKFLAFFVCFAVGLGGALLFETLTLLNFDVVQFVQQIKAHGFWAIFGFGSGLSDPLIPFAYITGLIATALLALRVSPWLEESLRFGRLEPKPNDVLAQVELQLDALLGRYSIFDSSKIEELFSETLNVGKQSTLNGPVGVLFQSSVAGAAALYAQLLASRQQFLPDYHFTVKKLEKWVDQLENLDEAAEKISRNQASVSRAKSKGEDTQVVVDEEKAAEVTQQLLLLGF